MDKITMEPGKIYFIAYSSSTQLVVRFKDDDATNYYYFDHIHYWNSFETFHKTGGGNYSLKSGVEELREATLPEKHALIKFELENNCI